MTSRAAGHTLGPVEPAPGPSGHGELPLEDSRLNLTQETATPSAPRVLPGGGVGDRPHLEGRNQGHKGLRLADCVDIRLGQSFRQRVLEDPGSDHFILQTRDVLPGGRLSTDLMRMSTLRERPAPNVKPGDIVVLCRGVRFNAGVVRELRGPTTAQNMFHILTPRPDCKLLPEFITGFINTAAVQGRLAALARGSSVAHINLHDLKSLRIPAPSIEKQRAFAALVSALAEERELQGRLATLRIEQLSALIKGFERS